MSVYVDALVSYPPSQSWSWVESCHLYADSVDELHAFAARIGLRRAWFQRSSNGLPHYDLTRRKRQEAVRAGAIEQDRAAAVETWRWIQRREAHAAH